MRRKRYKPAELSYFHLMSRTVNGEAFFGDLEREVFRKMIWQVADFSGIRVITYAVMKNHFHLFVEVPEKTEISDEELVRRFRVLYPQPTPWQPMSPDVLASHLTGNTPEGQELRRVLTRRMGDVSELMKTLKQRFSMWFNRSRERFGPVWSDRFKSVLVEGDLEALRTVAAYIDLNAVRAGLVSDPKDYRFCGYAEALGGGKEARQGLRLLDRDLAGYRQVLYGSGSGEKEDKASIPREEALDVLAAGGRLPIPVLLRCKVRYLTEGKVLGSEEFVARYLAGEETERKKPARPKPMQGGDWSGMMVGKGCQSEIFQ